MKKVVIGIIIVAIVCIGGFAIYGSMDKPKETNLTSAEITSNTKIATEVLKSVESGNYAEYVKFSDNKMKSNEVFTKLKEGIKIVYII